MTKNDLLLTDNDGIGDSTCQMHRGARGSLFDYSISRSSKRKIRYLERLKASPQYVEAVGAFNEKQSAEQTPLVTWASIAFRLHVYRDGRVDYYDDSETPATKRKSRLINRGEINKLISAFEASGFFSMKERYTTANFVAIDGRSGTITITVGGSKLSFDDGARKKTVVYTIGAPKQLLLLEDNIQTIVGMDGLKSTSQVFGKQ